MIICIMSGVEPLSQSKNYIFLDQPCPIAHDNDIGIFLFHQLRFFLPSVRIFLFHQPGFFSAIRNEAFTARFLHRILSLLHRILSFLYWIFSLLHRILSLFEWESWFGFFSSISRDFFLPSVGIFLFHQSGFFSAIRDKAVTARVLHRILSLLHRILSFLHRILSLLHRILSLFRIIKMHMLSVHMKFALCEMVYIWSCSCNFCDVNVEQLNLHLQQDRP